MLWAACVLVLLGRPLQQARNRQLLAVTPTWTRGTLPKSVAYRPVFTANPSIRWRGVHLFVGPPALAFQIKLMDRVLKPLGFNEVVLECERTRWRSVRGRDPLLTTAPQDLARLCKRYRRRHIEPIPLIESFGQLLTWTVACGPIQRTMGELTCAGGIPDLRHAHPF